MLHGVCPPDVHRRTKAWVQANLTLDDIRSNEWLFMSYHPFDYFMNVSDFPDVDTYQTATLENIYDSAARSVP